AAGRAELQRTHLLDDVALVLRQVHRELRELTDEHRADADDDQEGEKDGDGDREPAAQLPAPQQPHERCQPEAQQRGERHRHEDVAAEIERRHDDRADDRRFGAGGRLPRIDDLAARRRPDGDAGELAAGFHVLARDVMVEASAETVRPVSGAGPGRGPGRAPAPNAHASSSGERAGRAAVPCRCRCWGKTVGKETQTYRIWMSSFDSVMAGLDRSSPAMTSDGTRDGLEAGTSSGRILTIIDASHAVPQAVPP